MQAAVAERHDEQQLEKNLMVLFANPDQLRSASYRRVIEKNTHLVMQLLFDLIYNPGQTTFLKHGLAKGATIANGSKMLEYQAQEAWRIWNS